MMTLLPHQRPPGWKPGDYGSQRWPPLRGSASDHRSVAAGILPAVCGGIPAARITRLNPHDDLASTSETTRLEAGRYGSQRWLPLRSIASDH